MAKSLRSKVKQRYRRAKRHYIDGTIHTNRISLLHENVKKLQDGISIQTSRPKNAFLHPEDHEAIFPQKELFKPIDFRADALPLAGYCVTGCRRNFTDAEKLAMNLVVRSKDGLLPLEKRRLEEQKNNIDSSLNMEILNNENPTQALSTNKENDEDSLIAEIQGIGLISNQAQEFSLDYLNDDIPTLELVRHQEKVGGRAKKLVEPPKVKNKLKTKTKILRSKF